MLQWLELAQVRFGLACLWLNEAPGRKEKVRSMLFVIKCFNMNSRPSLGFCLASRSNWISDKPEPVVFSFFVLNSPVDYIRFIASVFICTI